MRCACCDTISSDCLISFNSRAPGAGPNRELRLCEPSWTQPLPSQMELNSSNPLDYHGFLRNRSVTASIVRCNHCPAQRQASLSESQLARYLAGKDAGSKVNAVAREGEA